MTLTAAQQRARSELELALAGADLPVLLALIESTLEARFDEAPEAITSTIRQLDRLAWSRLE